MFTRERTRMTQIQFAVFLVLYIVSSVPRNSLAEQPKAASDKRMDALVNDYFQTTTRFPTGSDQANTYIKKLDDIVDYARENGQEALLANRLSEGLLLGTKFTGGDYYVLWQVRVGGSTYVDKAVISALIRKVSNRNDIDQPLEVREELAAFVVRLVSASVEYDKSLFDKHGNVDWIEWIAFVDWWNSNRHTLVHNANSKKLVRHP